jgi:hypothetical protein
MIRFLNQFGEAARQTPASLSESLIGGSAKAFSDFLPGAECR